MGRDHSFPQNAEFFWAEPRNLPISAEFLCFYRILRNSVLDKYGIFWWSSGHRTVCRPIHDFTMKYMTATRALTGGILKILSWAYLKYCRAGQFVSCSYWRQILHFWWGSAATENELLCVVNLPRWAAEFGKLARRIWKNLGSLVIGNKEADLSRWFVAQLLLGHCHFKTSLDCL